MKKVIILGFAICFFHISFSQEIIKEDKTKTETKVGTSGPIILKAYQSVNIEGQKEEEKASTPASDKLNFGVRLNRTYKTKRADNDSVIFELQELKRKYLRDYYNRTNPIYEFQNKIKKSVRIYEKERKDDNQTYELEIPPLRANKIYQIKVSEYKTIRSKYLMFLLIHEEGINNWYTVEKEWMKMLQKLNNETGNYPIIYFPTEQELVNYKSMVDGIVLERLTSSEKEQLLQETIDFFPILNFKSNDPPTVEKVIEFVGWIQKKQSFVVADQDEFSRFDGSTFATYYDFVNVYKFYLKHLKTEFDNNNYTRDNIAEVKDLVDRAIKAEISAFGSNEFVPNYFLTRADQTIEVSSIIIDTFSENFETAFKRSLVPDFGLVGYRLGSSGNIKGTPFVGVNVSLAPVNKNAAISKSNLSFWQRTSIHTGVTLNSLAEENKREDFFNNLSLMLGMGYKIGTQATRINMGGILYNKIDAVTGDKSFAITPYIGLSIDIEIRKWLQEVIPSFGSNFKKGE